MRKFLKFLIGLLITLLLLTISIIKPIDTTEYRNNFYYTNTLQSINSTPLVNDSSMHLHVGWGKRNITPSFPLQISSYGLRPEFEGIHDSMYVRTFAFKSGKLKVCIITMDLLIVPPSVVRKAMPLLNELGYTRDHVYFSATHTHNAAGGWAENIGGRFLAGKYNEKMVQLIVDGIIHSLIEAEDSAEPASIGFSKINAEKLVENRLVGEEGTKDPWLRIIKFKTESNKTACLLTFSAHANCMPKEENLISCDYPGFLVDSLEHSSEIDFAAFCAGAVGSMKPGEVGKESFEKAITIADSLFHKVKDSHNLIDLKPGRNLSCAYFPIEMRDPNLKISNSLALRPWIFHWLLGRQEVGLSMISLGENVFIGTPCDFSGELGLALDSVAAKKNINLLITSFNGAYVGYITPDKYYDLVKYETREMNWYGPGNGSYFTELIDKIIDKASEQTKQ